MTFGFWNDGGCLDDFREAFLSTVEVGGDCDTNAAIVCGIVAAYGTTVCIPPEWLRLREPLPIKAP